MGKTYDIPGVGIIKLPDFEKIVGGMSSSKLKSLLNESLPDPFVALIKDILKDRGKKNGGLIEKPIGPGGPSVKKKR